MSCEAQIEDVLRLHPGVRDTAVVRRGDAIRALVVPNDAYIEEVLGFDTAASSVLGKWRKIFDLTQFNKQAASSPVGLNTLGWNSSYTRQPIAAEQIREWVESTVAEILPLAPKIAYEVGCGTGMLLLRIAPHCERYIAADFSTASLASLRQQIRKIPELTGRVEIMERGAHDFGGIEQSSVDTVVINSVVQYFPSISYLTEVLRNAVNIVRDGGHIFVGDVLDLTLQRPFAFSVVLFQAKDEDTVAELRARIERRIDMEQQMVLSPAYFLSLKRLFPRVSNVEIWPRRDRCDNEMSRYRYHAVLHVEHESRCSSEVEFVDWTRHEFTLDDIRTWLQQQRGACIGLEKIGNTRLDEDLAMLARLTTADVEDTARALRGAKAQTARRGINPRDLVDLGAGLGFQVNLSWAACRTDGSYDAVFVPSSSPPGISCLPIDWPQAEASEFIRFANAPGQDKFRRELLDQLFAHCRQNLPQAMVPNDIAIVDGLVTTGDASRDLCGAVGGKSSALLRDK